MILSFLPLHFISPANPTINNSITTNLNGVRYHREGNTISLSLDVPQVLWKSGSFGNSISLPNSQILSVPGYPELPYYSVFLSIPPDTIINPLVNLSSERILSVPKDMSISINTEPEKQDELITNLQECTHSFPQSTIQIGEPFWFRNQQLVSIKFYPVRWDCDNVRFLWNQSLDISFSINEIPERKNFLQIDNNYDIHPFQHQIINYEDSLSWTSDAPVLWGGGLQQPWTTRAKISVQESGIYRITFEDLQRIGFPLENINPNFFHIDNQGREVAFLIENEGDDKYRQGDSILFYAEPFTGDYLSDLYQHQSDHWPTYKNWQPEFSPFMLEKYTNTNVYWLYLSDEPGNQIIYQDGTPNTGEHITSFFDQIQYEEENVWWTTHFTNEDTWFWESIDVSSFPDPVQYPAYIYDPVISSDYQADVSGEIISVTSSTAINPDHRVQIFLNQQPVSEETWDGASRHIFKGSIDQDLLISGENSLSLSFQSQGLPVARYVFDNFTISYQRYLKANNNILIFNSHQTGNVNFEINNLPSAQNHIWNITNPLHPIAIQNFSYNSGTLTFGQSLSDIQDYITVNQTAIQPVSEVMTLYEPEDLLSVNNQADYIIISPHEFMMDIAPLVEYRESQGLKVRLIDLEDVYNQFNYGISHPIAVKNFFGYAYQHWLSPAPTYILLVGDGHWDLKNNRIPDKVFSPPNFVWVDPLQGEVDSLADLVAVVGDDIFPDAMIGRMPVNNSSELSAYINKTIQFEKTFTEWQSMLTFIADNYFLQDPLRYPGCTDNNPTTNCPTDTAGNFPEYVNQLLSDVIIRPYKINKIFLDEYDCRSASSEECSSVTDEIINAFNQGSQIITFNGHGAISYWAGEKVLQVANLPDLTNLERYPVVFSLDCVDGYWYYPPNLPGQTADRRSLSEEITRISQKGAVAMYSSPGNGYANGHDLLQRGFFSALMNLPQPTLGNLDLNAKLNLMSSHGNDSSIYTYMIFGDPALQINPINWAIFLPLITRK